MTSASFPFPGRDTNVAIATSRLADASTLFTDLVRMEAEAALVGKKISQIFKSEAGRKRMT